MKKRKPGRPKKHPSVLKTCEIRFKVTASDMKQIVHASRLVGKDVSEWARDTLIAAAAQRPHG